MATTRSSTAALCSDTVEAESYGRSNLKEEKEEVTELTERLKVARGRLVAAESPGTEEDRRRPKQRERLDPGRSRALLLALVVEDDVVETGGDDG